MVHAKVSLMLLGSMYGAHQYIRIYVYIHDTVSVGNKFFSILYIAISKNELDPYTIDNPIILA